VDRIQSSAEASLARVSALVPGRRSPVGCSWPRSSVRLRPQVGGPCLAPGQQSHVYRSADRLPSGRLFLPAHRRAAIYEICCGAILTQNTAWPNVEKALQALADQGPLTPREILAVDEERLQQTIRPSGYFRAKAQTARLCEF